MTNLSSAQLRNLSAQLFHYFRGLDKPPADEIEVPTGFIRKVKDNVYTAVVRFYIDYCGKKQHEVKIRMKVDDSGRFDQKTWEYINGV